MRIVSWNIQQGGGRRLNGIGEALMGWSPDIITLQEVREKGAETLSAKLREAGLTHSYFSQTQNARENGLLISSRYAVDAGPFMENEPDRCHILEAEIADHTLLPVHFPQKSAQVPIFEALLDDSKSLTGLSSLIIGDLNCGLPFQDSTEKTFVNAKYFQALLDKGWVDLYRMLNGQEARDYTWISPRTGRGFRYDHALASPSFAKTAKSLRYDHSVRERGLSDHSALLIELRAEIDKSESENTAS